jgi:MiaB/RimO family radical SAM methylthiotransferase
VFVNTCSIREKAETKVKQKLLELSKTGVKIGVLGCMAERLKSSLFEERLADIVVGPDGYRSLPKLVEAVVVAGEENAINVQLSVEETYADITPLRTKGVSAYISIMRGCNNMCSFCVVPFTRGRERSRPMQSILSEAKSLSLSGVKEITLLGQNVNSYFDSSENYADSYETAAGFSEMYKIRQGAGARFHNLLAAVAQAVPNTRIRFTSPHPKDFPPQVLNVMRENANICNNVHLPLQSGSDRVLRNMRRFYTQDAYLRLVEDIRSRIENVTISTDVISGFCGETEEDHLETVKVLESVKYEQAFTFAYSMRSKTHAYNNLNDDVPEDVKKRRLEEVIQTTKKWQKAANLNEIGKTYEVLIEGPGKKGGWTGKTTHNKRVNGPGTFLPGQLISAKIESATSQSLFASPT